MRVGEARDVARQWVMEEARGIRGFRGAYTAGSTNWLADDAELTQTSDLDVMVALAEPNQIAGRGKFRYGGVLLEASYLRADQLASADLVLGDLGLASPDDVWRRGAEVERFLPRV